MATQVEVFLAQPAIPNVPVNAGVAGRGFETAPFLDRCEEPDTCC